MEEILNDDWRVFICSSTRGTVFPLGFFVVKLILKVLLYKNIRVEGPE